MGRRKQRKCRICKKRPVWRGGDVANPGPFCKKCYHKRIWPEREAARRKKLEPLAGVSQDDFGLDPVDALYAAGFPWPTQPHVSTHFRMLMPQLPVQDLERVIQFYTRWLGFEVIQLRPLEVPSFATLVCDEVCLQFFVPNIAAGESPASRDATLSFQVADVAALRAHIGVDGGPEVYWHSEREFAVRDPSGYVLNFFEELDDHAAFDYEATDECDDQGQDSEGECDEIPF